MNKNSQNLKIYGVTLVGAKGQIILPAECRKDFEINVGDIFYIGTFKEVAFVMSNEKICSEENIWKFKEFIENEEQIKVGTKFQFVIPKQIRELLEIKTGNSIIVVGESGHGLGFVKNDKIDFLLEYIKESFKI
ncbi:AbrB/MazE/SpoVT family DNA-binding domain-containing protein [Candidatus Gracilibacteria bacterium]|nr:MAG: AbrB/MazE/SpoVT family DNA-binding domain-containing protein [Candidatus Gracilibacteria bacterium]